MTPSALRKYQRYLLYTLVVFLPVIITPTGRDVFRLGKEVFAQILALAIVCLAGVELWQTRGSPRLPRVFFFPLSAFCLWSAVSIFWADLRLLALYALFNLILFTLLALALARVLEPRHIRLIVLINLAPASFTAIYTVIQYFGRDPLLITPQGTTLAGRLNAGGLVGDVNSAGCYLAISLALAANSFFIENSILKRMFILTGCAATLVGLLFTQTLTAIGALAIAVLTLVVLNTYLFSVAGGAMRRMWLVLVCLLVVAAASGAAFVFKSGKFRQRIVTRYQDFRQGNWSKLTSYRAPTFAITWQMAMERPVTGHGLHSFERDFFDAKLRYRPGQLIGMPGSIESTPRQAHNEYLQVWAELGAAGLILLLAILGGVLYFGYRGIAFSGNFEDRCLMVSLLSAFGVVLVSSLGFFPGHLALTGVWIVVVAASIVSLGASSTTSFQNSGKQEQQSGRMGTTALPIWMPTAGALTVAVAGGFLLVSPLISNERVNEATALIERVMRTDAANVQPYLERSLTLLDYARQKNPLDAQIYQSAGTAHWFLEQFEDALKDFSYAALLDPTPEAFTNLGETYRGMGKLDMAEKSYDTALLYNPDFEKARNAKLLVEKMKAEKRR